MIKQANENSLANCVPINELSLEHGHAQYAQTVALMSFCVLFNC